MVLVLNIKQCRRFITKHVNLSLSRPTCQIDDNIDKEFKDVINAAIADGRLFKFSDDYQNKEIKMEGIGSFELLEDKVISTGKVEYDKKNKATIMTFEE